MHQIIPYITSSKFTVRVRPLQYCKSNYIVTTFSKHLATVQRKTAGTTLRQNWTQGGWPSASTSRDVRRESRKREERDEEQLYMSLHSNTIRLVVVIIIIKLI